MVGDETIDSMQIGGIGKEFANHCSNLKGR